MICGLGHERTDILEKKEKILLTAKSRLVGIKEYLEIYNHLKYFLWYFLNATCFTPNFWGGFWVLNPMSRELLRRNLIQPNILLFETAVTFWLKIFLTFSALLFRSGAAKGVSPLWVATF